MKRRDLLDAGSSRDDRRRKLVAVYLRVSSEEQREKETILTQRAEIDPWLRERGYEVFDWYADDGVSGDVPFPKRKEGGRLLEDAAAGKFGVVVVYKINRLSRRAEDALAMVRHFYEDLDLVFRCSAQDFEVTGATGKLTLTMMAAIAEFDKQQILENTRGGHKRRASKGQWPCGRPAYGYRIAGEKEPEDGRLVVHPFEGTVVQRIFRLYLEGMGMARISDLLTGEGVPPPKAGKHKKKGQRSHFRWNVQTISFILHNRVYVGEGMFYRTQTVRREGEKVGLRDLPEDQHIPIPCPALVTMEQFDAVQVRIERNLEFSPRNRKRAYLLSGLLFCRCCGYRYVGYAKSSRTTPGLEWRYYGCGTGWNKSLAVNCPGKSVRASLVEEVVWERICHAAKNPEQFVDSFLETISAGVPKDEERPILECRLAGLEEVLAGKKDEERRLLTAYRKGLLGDTDEEAEAELEREKADLDLEVSALREEVEAVRGRLESSLDLDAHRVDWQQALEGIARTLDRAEEDEEVRRQCIFSMVRRVEVGEKDGAPWVRLYFWRRPLGVEEGASGVSNCVQDMVRNWTQLEHAETFPFAA